MANKLNFTGLSYFYDRLKTVFASQTDLDSLSDRVDDIVAEGGEPNVIETVKVDSVALVPDAQKAVNIDLSGKADAADIPTATSDLTNDGDGSSNFATEDYVDQNGGKIDSISIDGTTQTIDANKNVALDLSDYAKGTDIPANVSDLTDDVGIQTSSDVSSAISTALANSGDAYQTESDVQSAIGTAVASAYRYKGSVANQAALPASGNTTGDVYDTQDTGMNYAWNGSAWDALGTYVDMSLYWSKAELVAITTAQIDTLFE